MPRQPTGKAPAVNLALPKPKSQADQLHKLLSQIEGDLPNFAVEDGHLVSRFILEHELSYRYPVLTSTQRGRVVKTLLTNNEILDGKVPERQPNGTTSVRSNIGQTQQANKAMNTKVSNANKPSTNTRQRAVSSPNKKSNQVPSYISKFAVKSDRDSRDSTSTSGYSDSSSDFQYRLFEPKKSDVNHEHIRSSTLNKFLGDLGAAKLELALPATDDKSVLELQIGLLNVGGEGEIEVEAIDHKIKNAIVFSGRVLEEHTDALPQYGLIGCITSESSTALADSRLFLNTNVPFSAFICGVQGSGKSHTTACIIENCIIQSPMLGNLPKPLSALVFNFAEFNSRANFRPSEVAFLASPNKQNPTQLRATKVKVLVSHSNYHNLAELYTQIPGVEVHPFKIHPEDLNISIMLTLMAVDNTQAIPLYLGTVTKILRQMATESGGIFDYAKFRRLLDEAGLDKKQLDFLEQRLDLLESFLDLDGETTRPTFGPGEITIIDLSCPFLDASTACVLFKIGMGIYLDSDVETGKLIVLDEAHKYMTDSPASKALTESLLSLIRQQRHYGARVLISTQEPTISPRLIDLCSMTVIHRFSSPDWMNVLKKHVSFSEGSKSNDSEGSLYNQILRLKTGEALVFAPSAILGLSTGDDEASGDGVQNWSTAANELIRARMRKRVTWDGGASILCV